MSVKLIEAISSTKKMKFQFFHVSLKLLEPFKKNILVQNESYLGGKRLLFSDSP
jgi:hypothetical protein